MLHLLVGLAQSPQLAAATTDGLCLENEEDPVGVEIEEVA